MSEMTVRRIPYVMHPNDDGVMTNADREAIDEATHEVLATTRTQTERKPVDVSRRAQAVSLAIAGMSWDKIAEVAGYSTGRAAQRAVWHAFEAYEAPRVDDLRNMENSRLDRQLAAIWPQVVQGNIGAGRLALQIGERRARLNGLDKQPEVVKTPGAQEVARWVQQVLAATGQIDSSVVEAEVIDVEVVDERPAD